MMLDYYHVTTVTTCNHFFGYTYRTYVKNENGRTFFEELFCRHTLFEGGGYTQK
jgi:hypothetical protein